ncbi:DivIVA domain-containing protein [Pelagirhabdus alkalitolerans]|uniref:DivIVA domain-containing protein n=1 Tax=Pelagirhabdus alkalitolerans TaxID=1612202 RepID=A0A1G6H9J5_9BACI|nr:cell division regulator GpsB [Pelagirhabdus alkalitolerans]SDB90940.1 DivIVA domain-containing protein [Pelagirhabdus alkalitolerans]
MSTNNENQLSGKDILDKQFKTSMRGYNQEEVDAFLDVIIQDYEYFMQTIEELHQENDQLKTQPEPTRQRVQPSNHQMNYDILKRVSNLEKAVFGKKYTDS